MPSITVFPSGHVTEDSAYDSIPSGNPLSNAVGKDHTNRAYAGFNLRTGSGSASYVVYTFDLSQIPRHAVIHSVTCQAGTYGPASSKNRTAIRQVQLFSGTVPKGSAADFSFSGALVTSALNGGTWTRAELSSARIRIYVTRGTKNTTKAASCFFAGASLTVDYTEPEFTVLRLKGTGGWVPIRSIWQKQDGIWVPADETALNPGSQYIKGS